STIISPSAPMDMRRSHSRRARAGKDSAGSPSRILLRMMKSFPAPFIFQNCMAGTLLFDWFCQDKKQERCHTRAAADFRRMAQIACPKFHNSSKKDRENGGGGPGTGEKSGKGVRVSELPFRETGQA